MKDRIKTLMALILLAAVAICFRSYRLSIPSFNLDESSSLFFSSYPQWRALFWDNHPPLYHLILKGWIQVFPMTEIGARSLSIAFSTLGVCALVIAGRFSGNVRRGWVAALFLTTSCLSIRYAQEVRMYAAMEAMTCVLLASLFYLLHHGGSGKAKLIFIATSVLTLLTHAFGFLSVLMILPVFRGAAIKDRHKFLALTIFSGIVLTFAFVLFQFDSRYLEWQRLAYSYSYHVVGNLIEFLVSFGQKDPFVTIGYAAIALFSLRHPDVVQRRLARTLFIGFMILLLCGAIAESFGERRVLIPRYFIFLNVYFVWCLTLGLEVLAQKFKKPAAQSAFTVAVITCFAMFSFGAYDYAKPDWRHLAEIAVEKHADLIMSTRPRGLIVPYYSSHNIPYEQFTYSNDFEAGLQKRLKTYKRIFIVDDNLSRFQYHLLLLSDLTIAHISYETFDLVDSKAGSVFGVLVYAPN